MKKLFLFLSIILTLSCKSENKISVQNDTSSSIFSIYFLDDLKIDKKQIILLIEEKFPEFKSLKDVQDSLKKDSYKVELSIADSTNIPPNLDFLHVFQKGLSELEIIKLQKFKRVLNLKFNLTSKNVIEKQARISELIRAISVGKEVIIADLNTMQWFNQKSWIENRKDNFKEIGKINIINQIVVQSYRNGKFCRATTMGMNKFCLPDFSIFNCPCSNINTYVSLINAIAQGISENPQINSDSTYIVDLNSIQNKKVKEYLFFDIKKNAKKKTVIKLKNIEPEIGDVPNKQFLICFEDNRFDNEQEELEHVISELFGNEDAIKNVNHDSTLLEESKKAKSRIPQLKKMFNSGLEPGFSILLKAPFKIDSQKNEWMWVEVTIWKSKIIQGILQNDPFEIENLKAGQIVNINEDDIFDYIINKPDGTIEGNETGKLIEKQ